MVQSSDDSILRPWLHLDRFAVVITDVQGLAAVRIIHGLIVLVSPGLHQPDANREVGLHLAHAGLYLVLINRLPNVSRPVLIKLVGILEEKHLVAEELVLAALFVTYSSRVFPAFAVKHDHHLALAARGSLLEHIGYV